MKRFFCLALVISLILIGCLPVLPAAQAPLPANQPPVAYIDSVSASQNTPGDKVTFTGHGVDPDGSIVAYSWRSSINGDLSTASSFSTTSLSPGTHSIWFKVQDSAGIWSEEVSANVNVVSISNMPPMVKLFQATPSEIGAGQSFILRWDVSNASSVDIDHDIGYVSFTGAKTIYPFANTVYKLTAANKIDSVTATATVTILTVPTYTAELYAIAAESGHVRSDGYVGTEPNVGNIAVINTAIPVEAFLSYDISGIPQGKKIKSVSLDVSAAKVYGAPFLFLGNMYIYACSYDQLRSKDYVGGLVGRCIYTTGKMSGLLSSALMAEAVQAAVDSGSPRFQMRFQFGTYDYRVSKSEFGYIDLGGAGSKLIVRYQD